MYEYEDDAYSCGFSSVAGIDEVGRGPLAGPVVAAAVHFPRNAELPPVDDSKKLTASKRQDYSEKLYNIPGIKIGLGVVSCKKIDSINILRATHLAMRTALSKISPPVDFVLIDGLPVKSITLPYKNIIKGDSKSVSIAAASIIAKVYRDDIMVKAAKKYPQYGFATNMGYGTKEHLDALKKNGATPIHRKSFKPVRAVIPGIPRQTEFNLDV
ncbi:MAG: ribonuclease HII [Verrucomicrobiota bacterium]|nr:ribonuclease HII [Verrucomicrobiota bacterium]